MTWHILFFKKYLDSLEEFRKNRHIKTPPKSPPTNFQSLGIFKNPIFIQKRIFLQLLAQSAQQPAVYHTRFLCQNRVLIVCMTRINCSTHTAKSAHR
jgi:hypothetical protein